MQSLVSLTLQPHRFLLIGWINGLWLAVIKCENDYYHPLINLPVLYLMAWKMKKKCWKTSLAKILRQNSIIFGWESETKKSTKSSCVRLTPKKPAEYLFENEMKWKVVGKKIFCQSSSRLTTTHFYCVIIFLNLKRHIFVSAGYRTNLNASQILNANICCSTFLYSWCLWKKWLKKLLNVRF